MQITNPDVEWLFKLYSILQFLYEEYPELFSAEDEEVLKITGELIRSLRS